MKMRELLKKTWTLGTIGGVTLLAAACSHGGGQYGAAGGGFGNFQMPVVAAPLKIGTIVETFSVTGVVAPKQAASLSSVASGNVLAVNAQIGQHVAAGDLLVKIDDGPLQAQLQSAQASLESARARYSQTRVGAGGDVSSTSAGLAAARAANETAQLDLQRNETLHREGYVAQSAVDTAYANAMAAQAQLRSAEVASDNARIDPVGGSVAQANIRNAQAGVDVAQSQVSLIRTQIAQTDVRAPFDGVVTSRDVDPGALASPGTTLMEVAQLDPVYVNAGVAGDQLSSVHVGSPVTITVASIPNRAWHATVTYLNLASAPGSMTYTARIAVPNADLALRAGMVADVAFQKSRKSGVLIAPRDAVFQTDTGYAMFVIDGGKSKSVLVDVGAQNDKEMEVAGPGLKAGVMAILNHALTLQPGMPVMVMPPGGGPSGPGASGAKSAAGTKPAAGAGGKPATK